MSLGELALMVRWLVEEGSERESIERDVGRKFEKLEGVRVPAPAGERVLCASFSFLSSLTVSQWGMIWLFF